jgi:hypothetical protein
LPYIKRFSFGKPILDIDQDDLIGDLAVGENIRTGRTYITSANYSNFHNSGDLSLALRGQTNALCGLIQIYAMLATPYTSSAGHYSASKTATIYQ